ncbi:MAG: lipid-A-disaccharide synthase-related protein, partial [Microcystaceae cyanobacterium]
LQQWSIPAFDLGNPMMDGIEGKRKKRVRNFEVPSKCKTHSRQEKGKKDNNTLIVLLLPGSRMPEAGRNWQTILEAVAGVMDAFGDDSVMFLAAIAPSLSLQPFQEHLRLHDWQAQPLESVKAPIADAHALALIQKNATLLLSQMAYPDCLCVADLAIAMAGTATEQFVGLGKPAIIIPSQGPQFTHAFAEAQTRLLGSSAILVQQPQQVKDVMGSLLKDSQRLQLIAANGKRRMGKAGAGKRIADSLMERLSYNVR